MKYIDECPSWSFPSEFESEHRFNVNDFVSPVTRTGRFFRRYGILLIIIFSLCIWTWAIGAIAHHNGVVETTEKLTAQFEAEKAAAVQAAKDEIAASRFISGEESKTLQMEREARAIAKALDGIKGITERDDDLRTYAWNILFRVADPGYPNSVEEVVSQPNQYMGYADNNPVVTGKYRIAYEVVESFYAGNWPADSKFLYAEWDAKGKVILRNTYLAGRDTEYWFWGK